ncbi:uncharacterized protein LOC134192995 [Corticium candelabrum]|uniref:uncharacterized protein LOC134192995 n=1 Tax=Corticium candelabrum TaxID=121492 RepID=UPI002E26497C|nr:uncharacterized protein LOC134192995 [Corticium candelabrum]
MASGSTALLSNESGESDDEFVESNERGSNRLGQNVENGAMQSTEHAMKQFSTEDVEEPTSQDYFFLSLFTTIFCCLPLGIIALIFSMKAGRLFRAEDEYGGRQLAIVSMAINTIAVVCGIVIIGVLLIYFVLT